MEINFSRKSDKSGGVGKFTSIKNPPLKSIPKLRLSFIKRKIENRIKKKEKIKADILYL